MRGVGAATTVLACALVALGCKRTSAHADDGCVGTPPGCFATLAEGCCADAGPPAECGPKNAPRGTHLKWVCPGTSVPRSGCRDYGPACAVHAEQVAPTLATPHLVSLTPMLPAGWADAGVGTVLNDKTEPISAYYALRTYSLRSDDPDGVANHRDLYFGKERLGSGVFFLPPSGDYVVYASGAGKKKNFVHGAISGKKRSITPKPYAVPSRVAWDLTKSSVTVSFEQGAPITSALP